VLVAVAIAARGPLQEAYARLSGGKTAAPEAKNTPPQVTVTPLKDAGTGTQTQPSPAPGGEERVQSRQVAVAKRPAAEPKAEKPAARKTRVFFVSVDPTGTIFVKGTIRTVPASDSPLKDAIDTLLKGPTSQEMNLGLLTMIPTDTKLRGATVRGDTAYLDFSESFRFNALGREGLAAQLRQVVFAATEFPTVKKVQILIEGKRVEYLGTEGVSVAEPLSRASFED
jgi:spore germination protein GerM